MLPPRALDHLVHAGGPMPRPADLVLAPEFRASEQRPQPVDLGLEFGDALVFGLHGCGVINAWPAKQSRGSVTRLMGAATQFSTGSSGWKMRWGMPAARPTSHDRGHVSASIPLLNFDARLEPDRSGLGWVTDSSLGKGMAAVEWTLWPERVKRRTASRVRLFTKAGDPFPGSTSSARMQGAPFSATRPRKSAFRTRRLP
jgi:hypothetical protein